MSYPESDPFSEAAQKFNLDKLKRALEESDSSEITDAPWMHFKGILCGYDETEIAEKLNLPKTAIGGIKVSLSRDITPKIKLILDYPETKKRPGWDKIRRDLLAKGYGIEAEIETVEIETIDWLGKCKEILIAKRELAINLFTSNMGVTMELDQIHVPLGLIERKEKPKIAGDVEGEKGSSEKSIIKIPYSIFENEILFELKNSSSRIISVLGEAGSGKTVQLLKIAQWILDQGDLPIFISLGSIPIKENIKEVKPLRDYLFDDWLKQFSYQVPNQWIKDLELQLQQGKVWLLLDGADEIVGCSDPLGYLSKSLNIPLFQNVKVIVTCRSNLWERGTNALASLSNKTYRMMRFEYGDNNLNIDTVSQFIDQWFRGSNPDLGKTLRQTLDELEKEEIRDLVTHPLMLSLLCFSWQYSDGKLSDTDTRASLYESFANAIFELKKNKFATSTEDRFQLKEVLGKLALESIKRGYKSILLYELVNEILEKPYPKSFDVAINLNWLNDVGVKSNTRQPVYAFFHPSFQEYFAACAIAHWDFFLPRDHVDHPVEGKTYRIFEAQWKQVFLLWLGRADIDKSEKEALIAALVNFYNQCDDFFHFRAFYMAAVGITEFKNCLLTDEIIDTLIEWGFQPELREERNNDDPLAIWAREILLETDIQKVITKLIKLLQSSQDTDLIEQVVYSLGNIAQKKDQASTKSQIITALIKLLKSHKNVNIIDVIVQELGIIGHGNALAITALIELLQFPNDFEVIDEVVYSLGKIGKGNDHAIKALIEATKSAPNFDIEQLAESVGKVIKNDTQMMIVTNNFIESLKNENETLDNALNKLNEAYFKDRTVDHSSIHSNIVKQKKIASLIEIIQSSSDGNTIFSAVKSLGEIGYGNEQAITILILLMQSLWSHSNTDSIAGILEKIESNYKEAITEFMSLIYSSVNYANIVAIAVRNLGKIGNGNERAITALASSIESFQDYNDINLIARRLGKIGYGNEEAFALSVSGLQSSQNNAKTIAIRSLGETGSGNEKAITALVSFIQADDNHDNTYEAIKSLGKIGYGNEKAITTLASFIHSDQNYGDINLAIKSLGEIGNGNEKAITALVSFIESFQNYPDINLALESLGEIGNGNEKAITTLVSFIQSSENRADINIAIRSLGEIGNGNEKAITALVSFIQSSENRADINVAVISLGKIGNGNEKAITELALFIQSSHNYDNTYEAIKSLGKIGNRNEKAITALASFIQSSHNYDNTYEAIRSLEKIGQGNEEAITALISFIQSSQNHADVNVAVKSLGKIGQGNEQAITTLVSVFQFSQWGDISSIGENLMRIIVKDQMPKVVTSLKNTRLEFLEYTSLNNRRKWNQYKYSFSLLWECAQTLSYPEFYKAWHSQSEIIHPEILEIYPSDNTNITQALNQQILDLPSQLQSTEKTYPIVINAQSLEDETDNDSIAQELCNQIYAIVFPNETDIPEINNAPQLKRLIPYIKKQLNTQNLALIFHNGEPNESLNKFCKKLTDVIHIKWITEQPIAYGVPPQENLVNILQNWIDHLG